MTEKMKHAGACVVIVLFTLIAYWNVQYNQLISYDEVKYLIENEMVRGGLSFTSFRWALTAVYDANWFPLTWLSHMLDVTLFGMDPRGHHLVNVLFHCANALLLFLLLARLTRRLWHSAAVALLFAVHPLHVESVAWVAERKDVLSTLFFMLTLHAYIYYVKKRTVAAYLFVLFLFACGLMSKPMLVSLPCLLLLLDYWPMNRMQFSAGEDWRQNILALVREKIPFAFLSLASSVVTFIAQRDGGAMSDTSHISIISTFFHVMHNYAMYLYKLFWPVGLGAFYPYRPVLPMGEVLAAFLILGCISFLAYYWRSKAPFFLFGWLWFLISLLPVVGIVGIGAHSIADRYTYIPSIGLSLAIVWYVGSVVRHKQLKLAAAGLLLILIAVLTMLTSKQVTYWKDSITLFQHTLRVTDDNWLAHSNLGADLLKYNRRQEALFHLQEAIRLNPESDVSYLNLGMLLNMLGDTPGAINALQTSLRLKPGNDMAYFMLAIIYFSSGDIQSAYMLQETLRQLNPDSARKLEAMFTTQIP